MTYFLKFLIVGLSNTLISYLVFILTLYALPEFLLKASTAQLLSFISGIFWSFYWNRTWTFAGAPAASGQMRKFICLQLGLLVASVLLIGLLVDYFAVPATPGWVGVMALITLANYLLQKNWVFA